MSAPVSHDPLVVQTADGARWVRAAVTVAGRGLYVLEGVAGCPREVMATLPELAVYGVRVPDELAVAVAEHGPFPMPVGTNSMTPEREQEIRALDLLELMPDTVAPVISGHLAVLLAEVDRLRAEASSLSDDLTGKSLSLWEDGREIDRLRLALASAKRGRRELRETLTRRTELLRDVQAMARKRRLEARGREAYGKRLKAENAALVEKDIRGLRLLQERTRELIAMECDRNSWKALVAELKATVADRHDDVAAALGYGSGTDWSDLISIAATVTTEVSRAEQQTVEVTRLRARVAELEAQAEKVAAFCSQRAEYVTSLVNCNPDNRHDYDRWTGHAEARRQLSQSLGLPVGWPAELEPRTTPAPSRDVRPGAEAARRMIRDRQTGEDVAPQVEKLRGLLAPACAFKNPHEPHTNRPGQPTEYQCPGVPTPTPGALAEQRHLMDPLDHTLTHLADEGPATGRDLPETYHPFGEPAAHTVINVTTDEPADDDEPLLNAEQLARELRGHLFGGGAS